MSQSRNLGLLALCLAAAAPASRWRRPRPAHTELAGSKVDNFMLADQTGMGHELYYYTAQPGHRHRLLGRRRRRLGARPPPRSPKCATQFKGKNVAVPDARLVAEVAARQVRRHARLGRPAGAGRRTPAGRPRARRDDDRRKSSSSTRRPGRSPITARSTTPSRRRRTRRPTSPRRSTRCSPASPCRSPKRP